LTAKIIFIDKTRTKRAKSKLIAGKTGKIEF